MTRMSRRLTALLVMLIPAALAGAARADDTPAVPPRKGHLDLVVDRSTHDFGRVPQDAVRKTTFTYTNRGEGVVEGIAARGECGCNVVAVSHATLKPGASGTLEVEFNTFALSGHLTKRIHLYSTDHTRGELVIPLEISIVEGMIVQPPGLNFGDFVRGEHPTKALHLKWHEGHGKPFEITSVDVPGYEFGVKVAPYQPKKDPRWGGWTVELTFKESPPLGIFSAEVLIRTTSEKRPRVTLPLSANVCGKVWMQARTLSFGAFARGRERTASLKFRPFDDSVTFKDVHAVARKGRIEVRVIPDPLHAAKGVWRLYGTVPPETEAGSLDDEVIELHTGAAGEEVTLVEVRGYVRTPRGTDDGH
jgi:hypothetical protein